MRVDRPFYITVLAIGLILVLPRLLQDGMFMDGVIYAAVSRNLALGMGNFWALTFSETFLKDYSEQLPLFFGLQSIFFKVLGSSIYTERIFQVVLAMATAFNISSIWKLTFKDTPLLKGMSWLPVLLWIIIPIVGWSYMNNVQETLMSFFATASIYFGMKGVMNPSKAILNIFLAGVFAFLCSFCKGFQGLFPIALVAIYWIFQRNFSFKRMLGLSLLLVIVPAAIYGVLWLFDDSRDCLLNNFNNRILRTFNNPGSGTTSNRLRLLYRLFSELLPSLILVLLICIVHWKKKKSTSLVQRHGLMAFFLLIGLSASIPLMVTFEQRGFYLVTSLPFFALALAVFAAPYLSAFYAAIDIRSKSFKRFRTFSYSLLVIALFISILQLGETRRDTERLHDVHAIGEHIPNASIVSVPPALRKEYSLVAYFSRHYNISLDQNEEDLRPYYLRLKGKGEVPAGYESAGLQLKEYDFYYRMNFE